jgi:hypothetical protein
MKLSDIKGDRTLEVIADLIEPISNIAQNKTAMELFKKQTLPKGEDANSYFLKRLKKALPSLLKDNKKDILTVMAVLNNQTVEEYEKDLTLSKLLGDLFEILTDEELLSFLS